METRIKTETAVEKWRINTLSTVPTTKSSFLTLIAKLPVTDLDAAGTLEEIFGYELTFIPTSASSGEWYVWNGVVHAKDDKGLIDDFLARALANALRSLCDFLHEKVNESTMSDDDKTAVRKAMGELTSYAKRVRSAGGLHHLKTRIRFEFQEAPDYFDHDQQWAVMADGRVIDLENIDAAPLAPNPKLPVSRHLGVSQTGTWPMIDALPVKWVDALKQWTPDPEVQNYLRLAAGAALLGRGDAKNIVTLVGISNTGKSTYLNVLKKVFGTYAGALPATAIVQKYGGATNFEQHKARGKRFLYLSEPQNARTDDAFLKNLSGGGDTIPTSEKGRDAVEWQAQCVLHIAANHIPRIDTNDNAIVERVDIVGFDHVFKATDYKGDLVEDLIREEGSEILFWILDGAREYLRDHVGKIPVPESIKKRSMSNVVESSAPLMWLQEMVDNDELIVDTTAYMKDMIEPKEGYTLFAQWCFQNGEKAPTQKQWLKEIEAFNKMPAARKGKRSDGKARVWGVLWSAKSNSRKVHLDSAADGIDWKQLQADVFTAPQEH
ncbi:phage/plasmid primase, P4 family [Arthrobacter sp. NPDC056493]|uniref:phage/plasmid primase, P4 family n=1 Tax=Arthrobacter sp. NPDC056493 TaxID=3345839 RepID=UPI00366A7F49